MERLKVFGVVAMLICAFAILIGSSRPTPGSLGNTSVSQAAQGSEASQEAKLPTLIPVAKRPMAPDFDLPVVGQVKTFHLSHEAMARPIVFSFWATWCGPCRMELPHLEQLSKAYRGRIGFYGVNSNDTPENMAIFSRQEGLTMPMVSDAQMTAARHYGASSIPMLIVVDRKGRVCFVSQGFDPDMDTYFPQLLDKLIKES